MKRVGKTQLSRKFQASPRLYIISLSAHRLKVEMANEYLYAWWWKLDWGKLPEDKVAFKSVFKTDDFVGGCFKDLRFRQKLHG